MSTISRCVQVCVWMWIKHEYVLGIATICTREKRKSVEAKTYLEMLSKMEHCILYFNMTTLCAFQCVLTGAEGNSDRCYRHEVQREMGWTNGGNGKRRISAYSCYYSYFLSSASVRLLYWHSIICFVLSYPVFSSPEFRIFVYHVVYLSVHFSPLKIDFSWFYSTPSFT